MFSELRAIDAHVAGSPVRLLTGGLPTPTGTSMDKRRGWMRRHADHVRRATILDPRGRADLIGALLTDPISSQADAGILFLDAYGYPMTSMVGVIAVATMALEKGLITKDTVGAGSDSHSVNLTFDTPAGSVTATCIPGRMDSVATRVGSVRIAGEPSCVIQAGCSIAVGSRRLRVDVAYSGSFYAIVDAEVAGVALVPAQLDEIRRLGVEICAALEGHPALVHPAAPREALVAAAVFTGPPESVGAHLRSVTISAAGGCDRSGIDGIPALTSVLSAMGLMDDGTELIHEGLLAIQSRSRLVRPVRVGELPGIITQLEGQAWTTSEQTFVVDPDDPLKEGFSW